MSALMALSAVLKSVHRKEVEPIELTHQAYTETGLRHIYNEDRYFAMEGQRFNVYGVFDGHGDNGVVAGYCQRRFQDLLKEIPEGDIARTLKSCFATVQQEVREMHRELAAQLQQENPHLSANTIFLFGGSTATVVVMDKERRQAFTATCGDSEARLISQETVTHLSLVRSWAHPKEAARGIAFHQTGAERMWSLKNRKEVQIPREDWELLSPKERRVRCLNMPYAIGDEGFSAKTAKLHTEQPIRAKVKVTVSPIMEPGDRLLLATDGLYDALDNAAIVSTLREGNFGDLFRAARLQGSQDDITAILVHC